MTLKAKSRELPSRIKGGLIEVAPRSGTKQTGPYHEAAPNNAIELVYKGAQFTESEGHVKSSDGRYREGGPFYTYRSEIHPGQGEYHAEIPINGAFLRYTGGKFCPVPSVPSGFFPKASSYGKSSFTKLDALGATAIAQTAPTNAVSKLAVLLGEARKDGIPSLPGITTWKERTRLAKAAGSEYLNYQFGWRPLVEETLQVGHAARHSRDIVKQYQKDEGRNVRREFDFPDETTFVTESEPMIGASLLQKNLEQEFRSTQTVAAKLTRDTVTSIRRKFSGAYTYALPSRTDSLQRMLGYGSEADKLFGITLTPDVLWELAPWSWAVDWFSNAGDVIHNTTSFGLAGLVMRYGYMMEEKYYSVTNRLNESNLKFDQSPPASSSASCTIKIRRPANPFGFGIGWEGLSPTQLAITAALGISHLR